MSKGDNGERLYIRIDGMYCRHCYDTVTLALKALDGVSDVSFRQNVAVIEGDALPDVDMIVSAVRNAGYETDEAHIAPDRRRVSNGARWYEVLAIAAAIVLIVFIIDRSLGYNVFNAIPAISGTVSYGMLFVTGLLTGIHCMSMCGAIGIYASKDDGSARSMKKPLLYNLGRVISYTLIGGAVGAIGSVFSLSNTVRGVIILFAAVCMLLMSLSMLGLFRFSLPQLMRFRIKGGKAGAFVIGLLNGLMPCGPLQAMQLYALSTGSFLKGALSMLLFALGTVPVMLGSGALINLTKGKTKAVIGKIASVLILVLSVSMLIRGLSAFGIDVRNVFTKNDEGCITAVLEDGVQTVEFELDYDSYADIIVQKDIPVRIVIHAEENKLTGCNNEVVCGEFGFDVELGPGDNIIEFTPKDTGEYLYTCWMNMIKNHIKVVDGGN